MSQSSATTGTGTTTPEANSDNPFDIPEVNARHAAQGAERAAAAAVSEERVKRWAPYRYAVECLPPGHGWARRLRERVDARNAKRNPMSHPPTLMVTGEDAVKAGATDEQLTELSALTVEGITELTRRQAAEHEATKIRVRDLARKLVAASASAVAPPRPVSLAELLAQPDDPQTYRIKDVWPAGGRVLLAAPYKAGKSTMVGNVIRGLVDGGQFLDKFDVLPAAKVVLVDTELDTRMLRRWLREQGIRNTEAVSVVPLRGAVSTFDITDPETRSHWAGQLAGADVVILDCLRPVLDSLGMSEDKDAGRVLVAFDALLTEVGAAEGMVVTHMGHQNERARGDSRLLDWPDALWKIVRGDDTDDGTRQAFFSALGRDVDVAEGLLTYDAATRRQTYTGGSRKDSTALSALPELMALVRLEPGTLSKNAAEKRLRADHGISLRTARAATDKAIADGAIVTSPGPRGALILSPAPGDPFDLPDGPKAANQHHLVSSSEFVTTN